MATVFNSTGQVAKPTNPMYNVGKHLRSVDSRYAITSGTSAIGDQFILAGPLTFSDRIAFIKGATPALTSANDNDLGFFYKNQAGTLVELSKDVLWNGVDLSSALTYRELLRTLNTSLDTTKNIGDLLSKGDDQEPVGGVYLVLTTNVANTAATATLALEVVVEEATTGV